VEEEDIDEGDACSKSFLVVELPHFNFPIIYAERPYPIVGGDARRLDDSWLEQTESFTGRKYYKNLKNHSCHWTSPYSRKSRDEDKGDSFYGAARTSSFGEYGSLWHDAFGPTIDASVPARWRRRVTIVFDPELDRENPIQTKYNKIARGVYDPTSKPNKEEYAKIKQIINSPRRRHEIQDSELHLLWQFRHMLIREKKALVKFLYCVDWRYAHDVDQAISLLKQWEPIDVDDALLLLSNDFTHDAGTKNALIHHVRRYAVETLNATASDDDIVSYLLQLVQALRYEPELHASYKSSSTAKVGEDSGVSLDASNATGSSSSKSSKVAGEEDEGEEEEGDGNEEDEDGALKSPLANFLISRAMRSSHLANYLHWYLFAECSAPTKNDSENALFSRVHEAFIRRLEGKTCIDIMRQTEMLKKLFKAGSENQKLGGNPDTKTKRMKRMLSPGGEYEDMVMFSESVPLPYNPLIRVSGVVPSSPKVFKSAMAPFTLTFTIEEKRRSKKKDEVDTKFRGRAPSLSNRLSDRIARLGQTTKESIQTVAATLVDPKIKDAGAAKEEGSKRRSELRHRVMFKLGDDLRQDQLILQIITLMDDILKRVRLDLRLTPFRVMATGHLEGLVEFVPNSVPLRYVGNIRSFLQKHNPSKTSPMGISRSAMNNFVKSCAGYAVITYILGIGDRHLDNILLKQNGQLFHIDFGYIFGRDPKWNAPMIRLTKAMLEAMGGPQSQNYRLFLELCAQAYNILRHHATLILNLLNLMVDANIEGVTANDLFTVKDRFLLDRSDEEAERYLLQLLRNSVKGLDALWADILDIGHAMAN